MSRSILVGALALSLMAVAGGASPASSGEYTTKAKIVDFSFQPKRIEIGQGTAVKWVNKGAESHTVTANDGSWDSGNMSPGDTFRKRFKQTGVFKFHCEIHPEMRGKVLSVDV